MSTVYTPLLLLTATHYSRSAQSASLRSRQDHIGGFTKHQIISEDCNRYVRSGPSLDSQAHLSDGIGWSSIVVWGFVNFTLLLVDYIWLSITNQFLSVTSLRRTYITIAEAASFLPYHALRPYSYYSFLDPLVNWISQSHWKIIGHMCVFYFAF